ncbi:hypothetical protein B0F90DRAFT_1276283 [Multifurca ochricompacta]|uniref:Uncharacterized protein n=1 Tax=Multifurca ochricompacta TaxID=376703 RepID=A0AAD4LY47_9AGAM|nr:hypothetical protein B0F90DRAFT_1276283 [Multifurca ochricompacta]
MARFCKALLAQFVKDFDKTGTLIFRSQWDVASLVRLFYTLGVGNEEDAEFWRSFIDGGPIEAEFMTRAREMFDIAVRDGPLLNFCRLGHLGVAAIQFEGSDLESMDIEKLWDLLRKMMTDSRLPLKCASDGVWVKFDRLRELVSDTSTKSSSGGKVRLQPLLVMIEEVYHLRPPATKESCPTEHTQTSGNSAIAQQELGHGHNRLTFSSDASTAYENDFGDFPPSPLRNFLTVPSYYPRSEYVGSYNFAFPYLASTIGPGNVVPPVNPYLPYRQHFAHRRVAPVSHYARQSDGVTPPQVITVSTKMPSAIPRNAHSALENVAVSSPCSPHDTGDAGQSGVSLFPAKNKIK